MKNDIIPQLRATYFLLSYIIFPSTLPPSRRLLFSLFDGSPFSDTLCAHMPTPLLYERKAGMYAYSDALRVYQTKPPRAAALINRFSLRSRVIRGCV